VYNQPIHTKFPFMINSTTQNQFEKPSVFLPLVRSLQNIPDNRRDQGKRFELAYILSLVLLGLVKGKTSIESCVEFGLARKKWFSRWFDVSHGVPNPTTVSRALAITPPQDVISIVSSFSSKMNGFVSETGVSIDGKTIKAISELKNGIHHFISLFSHTTCKILDQEGVVCKENEIVATPRLLTRQYLPGTMITGDALLTQKKITKAVRKGMGDYLLVVKSNHPYLQNVFEATFADRFTKTKEQIFRETRKTRSIMTTISLTKSLDLDDLQSQGWCDLALVGKLHRQGTRTTKRAKTNIDETIYFITSREGLTPEQAYSFLRNHWHIENKLHWQKDITWKEDRQRARVGHTPSILSYLRSFALQCIRTKHCSVTRAIESFTEKPRTYFDLLRQLQLV